MKHVLILGGGFAGVAAGVHFRKHINRMKNKDIQVTIIDKNPYHTFTPSLYELAMSEQTQQNVIIPFNEIFDHRVTYLKDGVKKINAAEKTVELEDHKKMKFDYLLIALGSQPSYMSIPGLEKYSVPMKSVHDALKIKHSIKDMCCEMGVCHRKVSVVIGGGGFTGTEIAAELLNYKDKLAREHNLDRDCLDITIIQGSDRLLKEMTPRVSKLAEKRLNHPNVHFAFGGHIQEVTKTEVKTDDGKSYPYNILIWTGGVEANSIGKKSNLPTNKRGQLMVNDYMQVEGYNNIYAAGDIAAYTDPKSQRLVPNVAQVAEEQGIVASENIVHAMKNKSLRPYKFRHYGYVVPLRGKYSTAELMFNIHVNGFPAWVIQQLVFLRYLLQIMPIHRAFARWNRFEEELLR